MLNIIRGSTNKSALVPLMTGGLENQGLDGFLFIGYPVISGPSQKIDIDALLITEQTGVVIIQLIEGQVEEDTVIKAVMNTTNIVKSKLLAFPDLADWDELKIPVRNLSIGPAVTYSLAGVTAERVGLCKTQEDVTNRILALSDYTGNMFESALSVIQTLTKLRQDKPRNYVQKTNSRGAILKDLEGKISTLDVCQSQAVIETVNGTQRIRGLAGSGKTIVLARKIAYLHAKNPSWKIAVTFNTRSLKSQFKRLISLFCLEQSGSEPDFERIKIIQAWGSTSSEGIYYNACINNNGMYYDFNAAKYKFSQGDALKYVCRELLETTASFKPLYDLILIDEAQDFSEEFLRLAYEQLDSNKRLVYAYDELQTLNENSMATPSDIWGQDESGRDRVSLESLPGEPKKDIILNVCYRNPRPILATAHALGFGIYRPQLIQMFDYAPLWEEIGYTSMLGNINEGEPVRLVRTNKTSPKFLEEHSTVDDLIQFNTFTSSDLQAEWIASEIVRNLNEDELRPSDIMVIHSNPRTTRTAVGVIRELLMQKGIKSDIAGVTASPDVFTSDDSITFTSIYRAKGNEAAMVYVINAEQCSDGFELSTKRNILFTAMTRTKAWLRVCGVGPAMTSLTAEFEAAKSNRFDLEFSYPTSEQRKRMRVVNRDMSDFEQKARKTIEQNAKSLSAAITAGEISIDEFDPDTMEQLSLFFSKKN